MASSSLNQDIQTKLEWDKISSQFAAFVLEYETLIQKHIKENKDIYHQLNNSDTNKEQVDKILKEVDQKRDALLTAISKQKKYSNEDVMIIGQVTALQNEY